VGCVSRVDRADCVGGEGCASAVGDGRVEQSLGVRARGKAAPKPAIFRAFCDRIFLTLRR
jgi:hypothetical protein